MFRFASLGSGSKGNATLIEKGQTRILVDCGFALKDTERRLSRLGCPPDSLSAILVTHEHSDHAIGVGRLARRYHTPVWLTAGTYQVLKDKRFVQHHLINADKPFTINDLEIHPYTVPHDAREPCQFLFSDGVFRLALLTDVGSLTPYIIRTLARPDALLLECNYDAAMLAAGPYPHYLKSRVGGLYGHLANEQATQLLKQINTQKLQHLIGMHLSEKNNLPHHALQALSLGLGCQPEDLHLATQDHGFSWRVLK